MNYFLLINHRYIFKIEVHFIYNKIHGEYLNSVVSFDKFIHLSFFT